jgi:hypothetical protein
MEDLIDARIRKYIRDIEGHRAPSQPDGVCRCSACDTARSILSELMYMKMAHRNIAARQAAPVTNGLATIAPQR